MSATTPVSTGIDVTPKDAPGPLAGTLLDPGGNGPVVLIYPGSGPTDRDGNNPLGVTAASYRLLAEALAARGIATVRVDKRGMFGSKAATADANNVPVAQSAADIHAWADEIAHRTGRGCVWVLGHSEGGLIALQAAQDPRGLCGVILVSTAGRPLGTVVREQLRANPANAPILDAALAGIDSLEKGKTVDTATLPAPLLQLFAPQIQPYLIDLMAHDPAALAAAIKLPVLIVQGDRDLQVSVADAQALAKADPEAKLAIVPGVNHVLKVVASDDRAANFAAYADPSLPIAAGVVDAVAAFVTAKR